MLEQSGGLPYAVNDSVRYTGGTPESKTILQTSTDRRVQSCSRRFQQLWKIRAAVASVLRCLNTRPSAWSQKSAKKLVTERKLPTHSVNKGVSNSPRPLPRRKNNRHAQGRACAQGRATVGAPLINYSCNDVCLCQLRTSSTVLFVSNLITCLKK